MQQTHEPKTLARPTAGAFIATGTPATAKSSAGFSSTRRGGQTVKIVASTGPVMALRDTAPGFLLLGYAIAEAVFVEPVRGMRRRLRARSA